MLKLKEFDKVFQKFNEASVLTHKALILPSLQFLTLNLHTKQPETQQIIIMFKNASVGVNTEEEEKQAPPLYL